MFYRRGLWLLVVVSLVGCTPSVKAPAKWYSGETLPVEQLARLQIPDTVKIRAIDGRRVKEISTLDSHYEVLVLPGKHEFIAQYQDFIHITAVEFEKIRSEEVQATMEFAAGKTYRMQEAKVRDVFDAYDYAKAFEFKLTLVE